MSTILPKGSVKTNQAALIDDSRKLSARKGSVFCCGNKAPAIIEKDKLGPPQPDSARAVVKSPNENSSTSKKQSGLSIVPEERAGDDSTPADLDASARELLSPPNE